jgi:hypothetical protein
MRDRVGGTGFFRFGDTSFTVFRDIRHDNLGGIRAQGKDVGAGIDAKAAGNTETGIDRYFHGFLQVKIIRQPLVLSLAKFPKTIKIEKQKGKYISREVRKANKERKTVLSFSRKTARVW